MFDKTVLAILANTLTLLEVCACFVPLSTKQLQHQYTKKLPVFCLQEYCTFFFSLVIAESVIKIL